MRLLVFCLVYLTILPTYANKDLPRVSVGKLKNTVLEKSLFFPVQVQSRVHSQILSDNNYIVIKRLVNLGDRVKKGQNIMVLRNQDLSVHYEKRFLKAPVAGVIAALPVTSGQYVNKNQPLALINDPNNLFAKIEVSAVDYKKLKKGLKGKLTIQSMGLENVPLTVQGIGTAIDNLTGTIAVELNIEDKMDVLIPGAIGLAEIILNKEELALVQEKSIFYIGDEVFIATLDKNKVKKVKVKLGQRFKDKIEVLEGLKLGEEYVTETPKFLRDDEEVERIEKK